jgi:predicted GNAT family acetyltransferase
MTKNKKYIFENTPIKKIQVSNNINIETVTNFKDFKKFYKVLWKVYRDNKYWVPPFWHEYKIFFKTKNEFWRHSECCLFLAYKNESAVGRIATIIDHSFANPENKKIGFFGFFECLEDKNLAFELLKVAEEWLKSKKVTHMQGPINARVDMGSGLLIKAFDSIPYFFGNTNPPYYVDFVKDFGMLENRKLISLDIDLQKDIPKKVKEASDKCIEKGVKIKKFRRWQSKKIIDLFADFLIGEFSDNWGYSSVPIKEVKDRFGVKQLKWIADPRLFLIAEVDNELAGFRWALPDYNLIFKDLEGKLGLISILKILYNRRKIDRGRFIITVVKSKFRGMGIATCMNYHIYNEMQRRGYKSAEFGWIDEDNIPSIKAGEKLGGVTSKIYIVFEKTL